MLNNSLLSTINKSEQSEILLWIQRENEIERERKGRTERIHWTSNCWKVIKYASEKSETDIPLRSLYISTFQNMNMFYTSEDKADNGVMQTATIENGPQHRCHSLLQANALSGQFRAMTQFETKALVLLVIECVSPVTLCSHWRRVFSSSAVGNGFGFGFGWADFVSMDWFSGFVTRETLHAHTNRSERFTKWTSALCIVCVMALWHGYIQLKCFNQVSENSKWVFHVRSETVIFPFYW